MKRITIYGCPSSSVNIRSCATVFRRNPGGFPDETLEMQVFQLKALQETVKWVYDKVPFYKNTFEDVGLEPGDVKSLDDVRKLPFTGKTDLLDNYPFGLCAVPMSEVVRIHASSGTTGKPITGPYTAEDLDEWAECMARNLVVAGIGSDDICQNAHGMGLFTGGLRFHQGVNKIGAAVIPASSGQTERQVILMQDFRSTALFCTPSFLCVDHCGESRGNGRGCEGITITGGRVWSRAMDR